MGARAEGSSTQPSAGARRRVAKRPDLLVDNTSSTVKSSTEDGNENVLHPSSLCKTPHIVLYLISVS